MHLANSLLNRRIAGNLQLFYFRTYENVLTKLCNSGSSASKKNLFL